MPALFRDDRPGGSGREYSVELAVQRRFCIGDQASFEYPGWRRARRSYERRSLIKKDNRIDTISPRVDARLKVTGAMPYAADKMLPGTLHVAVLRSPHAHALIKRIERAQTQALDGVHCVLIGADVPDIRCGRGLRDTPILAVDKVRFAGEGVAAVAAETWEIAEQAIALLQVEYEPLPAVFDVQSALRPDAPPSMRTLGRMRTPPTAQASRQTHSPLGRGPGGKTWMQRWPPPSTASSIRFGRSVCTRATSSRTALPAGGRRPPGARVVQQQGAVRAEGQPRSIVRVGPRTHSHSRHGAGGRFRRQGHTHGCAPVPRTVEAHRPSSSHGVLLFGGADSERAEAWRGHDGAITGAIASFSKATKVEDPKSLERAYEFYAPLYAKYQSPLPPVAAVRGALDDLAATIPAAKGADPGRFIDPQFMQELQASGFIKQAYGA